MANAYIVAKRHRLRVARDPVSVHRSEHPLLVPELFLDPGQITLEFLDGFVCF